MAHTPARLGPFALVALDSVSSTNDEARARAAQCPGEPCVVWARRQTAGRGRRNRAWQSLSGNLFASFAAWPRRPRPEWAQASFAAALAVADTVGAALGPAAPVTLKWPNDVLVAGGKVAGILLENTGPLEGAGEGLVIGIGLNVAAAPAEVAGATALSAWASPPPLDEILAFLADRLAHWLGAWEKGGFAGLREAWLGRAAGVGGPVEVRLGEQRLTGTFADLDAGGALVLRGPDGGQRRIDAGDVLLPTG